MKKPVGIMIVSLAALLAAVAFEAGAAGAPGDSWSANGNKGVRTETVSPEQFERLQAQVNDLQRRVAMLESRGGVKGGKTATDSWESH